MNTSRFTARVLFPAIVALAILTASPVVAIETLPGALASLADPTLAGNTERVDDFDFEVGNAVFTLTGEVEGVLGAEKTIGFAFKGKGKIAVEIVEGPFQQANMVTLKDEGRAKDVTAGQFVHAFDGAVFFTNALPAGLFTGEHVTDSRLAEILARSVDRWQATRYPGLDHLLAPAVLQADAEGMTLAVLWDGNEDSAYFCDTSSENSERYGVMKRTAAPSGGSFQALDVLIEQPAAFDPTHRPQPDLVQTAIDIQLVSRDNVNATEVTTTTVKAGRSGVELVVFDMLNGRSERPDAWDERSHPIRVTRVLAENGRELEFSHKYDQLLVRLAAPLAVGESVTLTVHAEGAFLKNFSGDAYLVLGNMAYLPQLSVFNTLATFHSVVKVKEPFLPVSCGRTVRRWSEDGLNCLESTEDHPVAFPFMVVGKFEIEEKRQEGYDILVYSYGSGKKKGTKSLLRNGLAVLDFYSNGMEPFPYGELEVIEIPYYRHFFWQAPAGLVEITSEGIDPLSGDMSDLNTIIKRYASKGQNARFAHEIAHQWFGNLIGWATPYDNWLSESFAEYLSYLFMSEGAGDKRKAKVQFAAWEVDTEECSKVASIYGASALNGDRNSQQCYTQLLYGKGPYVLHALRHDMGDANFKKMLYYMSVAAAKKSDMKMITEDVILFANAITGKDYHPWFERYVYGTEVPALGD